MNPAKLIKSLTYLGATPFFLALCLQLTEQPFLGIEGTQWFLTYALVILSFMAGTLWGQVVNASLKVKRIALITNVITLAAWFAFLLAEPAMALIVIGLGFAVLYWLEWVLMSHIQRPAYYLTLRFRVTALVLAAHALMFWQV